MVESCRVERYLSTLEPSAEPMVSKPRVRTKEGHIKMIKMLRTVD